MDTIVLVSHTVFSGSGKSYTQFGNIEDDFSKGIIPRCIENIFNKLKEKDLLNYYVSYFIFRNHLENIRDLLSNSEEHLKFHENIKRKGFMFKI